MPVADVENDILETAKGLGMDIDKLSMADGAPVVAEPEGVDDASVADDDAAETAEAKAQRVRDEKGRFVAQEADSKDKAEADEKAPPADEEPDIEPPHEWSAADQDAFRKLAPEARKFVDARLKAVGEQHKAIAQEHAGYKQFADPFLQVLQPRMKQFQEAGIHPANYVNMLMGLAEQADRDPAAFLKEQARQRGIDLRTLVDAPAADDQYVDPQVKALEDRIAGLQGEIQKLAGGWQGMQQHAETTQQQRVAADVANFAASKDESGQLRHPYYTEVRAHMSALLEKGIAHDLDSAYEQAVHANPETRAKLQSAARAAEQRRADRDAREKAQAARRAGSSVVGEGAGAQADPDLSKLSTYDAAMQLARKVGYIQ